MTIVRENSDELKTITVLLLHSADEPAVKSLGIIEDFSRSKEISDVLVCKIGGSQQLTQLIHNGYGIESDFGEIIASCGELDRLEVVTFCTSELSQENQSGLRNDSKLIMSRLRIGAPAGSSVREHRIYFPDHRNFGNPNQFLTGEADSRLVTIPEDRGGDTSFARPVSSSDPVFSYHIATELISICGFWISINSCVLERINQQASGTSSPLVQIVRSFARSAKSPVTSLMDEYESADELPVPVGLLHAPNPIYLVEEAANKIYTYDFQLRPENKYSIEQQKIEGKSLLRRIFGRIWRDFKALGRTLFKGYTTDFNELVDEFAQGLIGENSWLSCLPSPSEENSLMVTQDDIDEVIEELEHSLQSQREIVWTTQDPWPLVIREILGVIDGGEEANRIREDAGNKRWVAVERDLVGSTDSGEINEVVQYLLDESVGEPDSKKRNQPSLLQIISKKFHEETVKSRARCERLLNHLKQLKPEDKNVKSVGVSKTVTITFYASLFLFLLTFLVFPDFMHRILDFHEEMRGETRIRWFYILSAVPAFSLALFVSPLESKRRQNFMLGFFASYLLIGLIFFDFIPAIDLNDFESRRIFETVLLLLVLLGAYLIIRLYYPSILKRGSSSESSESSVPEVDEVGDHWNARGKTLLKLSLPPYAFILTVCALNNDKLLRKGFIEENSGDLFLFGSIFSLAVLLITFIIIDVVRQREELSLKGWKAEYIWHVKETENEYRNFKIIQNFETQWLGTGAVLARLLQYPYGKSNELDSIAVSLEHNQVELLKTQTTLLKLTEEGRQSFEIKAQSKINSPGWLSSQYEKLSKAFLEKVTGGFTDLEDEDLTQPESCPYPVAIEDAIAVQAKGRRWPFCYQVFNGDFDYHLRKSAEETLTELLLETFINNPNSHEVLNRGPGLESVSTSTLSASFGEILPTRQATFVPAVFGRTIDINYNTEDRLESHIWWPKTIELPAGQEFIPDTIDYTEDHQSSNAVIVQAVRVDLSGIAKLHDFFIAEKSYKQPEPPTKIDNEKTTEW